MISKSTIVGRVAEMLQKTTAKGNKITSLTIVTERRYFERGEEKFNISSHNVNCYFMLAEMVNEHVAVGDMVYVEGNIDNKKTENDLGEVKYVYCIQAIDVQIMPNSRSKQNADRLEHRDKGMIN